MKYNQFKRMFARPFRLLEAKIPNELVAHRIKIAHLHKGVAKQKRKQHGNYFIYR